MLTVRVRSTPIFKAKDHMKATTLYGELVQAKVCTPTFTKAAATAMSFRAFIGSGQRSIAAAALHKPYGPTAVRK